MSLVPLDMVAFILVLGFHKQILGIHNTEIMCCIITEEILFPFFLVIKCVSGKYSKGCTYFNYGFYLWFQEEIWYLILWYILTLE